MSDCRSNKRKYNCGNVKQNARCVYYDGYLPDYSKLKETCVNLEDTTEELYRNQEKIYEEINLENLGKSCINYSPNQKDRDHLKVKEALLTLEQEICKLKTSDLNSSNNFDISELDLKCFGDKCNKVVVNLKDLLQKIIDELCKNKTETNGSEIGVWSS